MKHIPIVIVMSMSHLSGCAMICRKENKRGFTLWAVPAVLALKKENPALKLHCILPYKGTGRQVASFGAGALFFYSGAGRLSFVCGPGVQ